MIVVIKSCGWMWSKFAAFKAVFEDEFHQTAAPLSYERISPKFKNRLDVQTWLFQNTVPNWTYGEIMKSNDSLSEMLKNYYFHNKSYFLYEVEFLDKSSSHFRLVKHLNMERW